MTYWTLTCNGGQPWCWNSSSTSACVLSWQRRFPSFSSANALQQRHHSACVHMIHGPPPRALKMQPGMHGYKIERRIALVVLGVKLTAHVHVRRIWNVCDPQWLTLPTHIVPCRDLPGENTNVTSLKTKKGGVSWILRDSWFSSILADDQKSSFLLISSVPRLCMCVQTIRETEMITKNRFRKH